MNGWETYENKKCLHILERGKNKGIQCSRNCHIGMDYCLIHNKKHKEIDDNNINNGREINNRSIGNNGSARGGMMGISNGLTVTKPGLQKTSSNRFGGRMGR